MQRKRITSHTPEFPQRADVIRSLIEQMKDKGMAGSWAHFEIVEEGGWFKNLLFGKSPWIEVAMDSDGFELNLGFKKEMSCPAIPWPEQAKRLWKMPLSDSAALADWIDSCFNKAFDVSPERKLTGWIED